MSLSTFFQGFLLGLAYVAPIGVQNLFVINSGLSKSPSEAFRAAAVVIFFDVLLSLAGFFGVGALITASATARLLILGAGSVLVLLMGARLVLRPLAGTAVPAVDMPLWKVVWLAFAVTWLNPQAILDVSLLLGAMRATLQEAQATFFIAGVATASCLWFTGLTTVTLLLKSRFTPRILRLINLACGLVLCAYGLGLALSLARMLRG